MRIKQLPAHIANQIAAGEVIERPASVVKELLENSLDAGASSISIDIGFGGLNHIKISDNGTGIVAEDLPLAIAAHATSKIDALRDLYSISSMGFRGEALASIASVSRMSIQSKPKEQGHAMSLSVEGGSSMLLKPCARNQGTTIEVRDIFFNAPVRKKFLKSERSEFLAIEMVVKRFALSAPDVAIQFMHNEKLLFKLAKAESQVSRLERIRKLLGKTFVDNSYFLDVEHAGLRLQGCISTPDYQLNQNDKQWIYVNQRMVKDKLLNHALKQAYESTLHPGKYPACLLYFSIKPAEVDVNVHPTKHEVRFQQPRLVHDFISSQLLAALEACKKEKLVSEPFKEPPYQGDLIPAAMISEPYKPSPLIPVRESKNRCVLNSRFVLLFEDNKPYLIDIIKTQQKWLLSRLSEQNFPLLSRPLLVPIRFPIKDETKRHDLIAIGIETDLASEDTVLIRSLPIMVPHLQLKVFLSQYFNNPCCGEKLLELLTTCQSFDAHSASQEEMEELLHFSKPFSKHLSQEICEALLND